MNPFDALRPIKLPQKLGNPLTLAQIQAILSQARIAQQSNKWQEASNFYRAILQSEPNHLETLVGLGLSLAYLGLWQESVECLFRSARLDPTYAPAHLNLGVVLQAAGRSGEAEIYLRKTLELEPANHQAGMNLAVALQAQGKMGDAEAVYRHWLLLCPEIVELHLNFGQFLLTLGRLEEAKTGLLEAITLHPDKISLYQDLGIIYANMQLLPEAEDCFRRVLASDSEQAALYNNLASVLWEQRRFEESAFNFERAISRQPDLAYSLLMLGKICLLQGQTVEAEAYFRRAVVAQPPMAEAHYQLSYQTMLAEESRASAKLAVELEPNHTQARWLLHLALPMLYESVEAIEKWRLRFDRGLTDLTAQVVLQDPAQSEKAFAAVLSYAPFYLPYQGRDCTEPLTKYGQLLHKVVAANFPDWSRPRPLIRPAASQKIRIGYLSYFLCNHNGAKWALGWTENQNRQEFEVYTYHIGNSVDETTERFRRCSTVHRHFPNDFESACRQIIDDQLHVLIFTDIGMVGHTMAMAALRLAPIQCGAWGHPTTSGLPTIDYYLSSEAMEPPNGQSHYTEQLIKLPKIGIYYDQPVFLPLSKHRSDFGLPLDSVVCLCCQSLYKYLPQYDAVIVQIAQQVPQARFVFISHLPPHLTDIFQQRLSRAFACVGLSATDHCLILSEMPQEEFFQLYQLADVYLDSFCWSGGNTTLQALACGLPVVTCPGSFMRGRHSYGMLRVLGLDELIAVDPQHYVQIAVGLVEDKDLRRQMREKILQRQDQLFEDRSCVAALELFLKRVVRSIP
jgi:protein O-GlcNAc transferase